jgi:hypothetical protein
MQTYVGDRAVTEVQFLPPTRNGTRPHTTSCAPHSQIDQLSKDGRRLSQALVQQLSDLDHVEFGPSYRAPPGTVGLYLQAEHCCDYPRAFLLGREFAHIHLKDDGSLHAILPEPLRTAAIRMGWAEAHPLAGQPTVSLDTVMIYAPRNMEEVDIIAQLVRQSWLNAGGFGPQSAVA